MPLCECFSVSNLVIFGGVATTILVSNLSEQVELFFGKDDEITRKIPHFIAFLYLLGTLSLLIYGAFDDSFALNFGYTSIVIATLIFVGIPLWYRILWPILSTLLRPLLVPVLQYILGKLQK